MPRVDAKDLTEAAEELMLKLQMKGYKCDKMQDFFFKPFNRDSKVSIKAMQDLFELNGVDDTISLKLARFLIEPQNEPMVDFTDDASGRQGEVIQILSDLIGPYNLYNNPETVKAYTRKVQDIF